MQAAGLLQLRRGRVCVADLPGLRVRACECYEAMKQAEEAILRPLARVSGGLLAPMARTMG